MQKLQITVSEDELRFLEGVRATGFSSIQEVIRCAALSYVDSKAGDGLRSAVGPDAGVARSRGGVSAPYRADGHSFRR